MRDEGRRYRILGVLGEGGFGRVYKARLEGPQGFLKDVAIKLLNDDEAPEAALMRFRDESRILGLIRDRAIVNVDPPTRLDGRWAVVMEYVEGQSLAALRKAWGKIPPRVALGIVQEVARALDKVYRAPGPEGEPLQLLHRDIKPANLQVTPSGEVKILDFGIARAQFEQREAHTTNHIGGTFGYIAPERLEGIEGPEGDVFSLGIVLQTILTGRGPKRRRRSQPEEATTHTDSDYAEALALAKHMAELEFEDRPTCREVEDRCMQLVAGMQGPTLRRWAEEHVVVGDGIQEDMLIGNVLTETMATVRVGLEDSQGIIDQTRSRRQVVMAGFLGSAGSLVVVVALLSAFGGAWLLAQAYADKDTEVPGTPDLAEVQPAEPEPAPQPEPPPAVAPDDGTADAEDEVDDPEADETDEPEPEPAPTPLPSPAPSPVAPAPRPAPTPRPAPAPEPAPAAAPVATFPIVVTSKPLGAAVWVDGTKVGSTPLINHPLSAGSHTLKLALGDDTVQTDILVGKRAPTRYVWEAGQAAVEAGY